MMVRFWLDKLKTLFERVNNMTSFTVTGKILALIVISALAVGLLALFGASCRATVPVVVSQNNFNCDSVVENHDGTINFSGCRSDGRQPVEAGGSPGDEIITVPKIDPSSAIQPGSLERFARNVWPIRDPRLN